MSGRPWPPGPPGPPGGPPSPPGPPGRPGPPPRNVPPPVGGPRSVPGPGTPARGVPPRPAPPRPAPSRPPPPPAEPQLLDRVRGLVRHVAGLYQGGPAAAGLDRAARRLDEPLRVAIAGRIKAGKSTLLNAMVGQELAATDAGECTRIVTWFRDGHTYRVQAQLRDGSSRQLPPGPTGGLLDIDLGRLGVRRRRPPAGRLAVAGAAADDADRHPRPRLAERRALPQDRGGAGARRGRRGRGRRGDLPDAARPRVGRALPRGVPRRPHRPPPAEHDRRSWPGPTRSGTPGRTRSRAPRRSPPATARTSGSAACARRSSRWPGCSPRAR